MLNYFGWGAQYPFLKTIGEVVYYGTIVGATIVFLILVGKRLLAMGYPKQRVVPFIILSILISLPAGYFGSRAAGMFYRPFYQWSVQAFFGSMFHGSSHTFHASLVGPLIFGAVFCYFLRLKFLEAFDSIYLYMPLAHALGRVSCLFIGCCWGKLVVLNVFGMQLRFQNPMPLYAIIANICIYLFLRRLYANIYATPWTRERYRGVVLATYFLVYAAVRVTFEVFRQERRIFFHLTQAQIAMGIYILFALALFLAVVYYNYNLRQGRMTETAGQYPSEPAIRYDFAAVGASAQNARPIEMSEAAAPAEAGTCTAAGQAQPSVGAMRRLLSAAGMAAFYLLAIFLIFYLTRQLRVWKWPFQSVHTLPDAYGRILYYLPVMLLPAGALLWMKTCNERIRPWFKWDRFSFIFLIGLAVSVYYAIELLVLKGVALRGYAFWPPVIIMSAMNAFAEEVMYRLALYRMVLRADYSRWTALIVQSAIYSVLHFMVAGPVLGLFSLIYGFILGWITDRSNSLVPAILCHFIIDLGCIGMPLLRLL